MLLFFGGEGELELVVVVHQLSGVEYTHSVSGICIYIRCIHIYLKYQENIVLGGSHLSRYKNKVFGVFFCGGGREGIDSHQV